MINGVTVTFNVCFVINAMITIISVFAHSDIYACRGIYIIRENAFMYCINVSSYSHMFVMYLSGREWLYFVY